jgi:Na+/melibiose symporter-like transporter
MGAVLFISMGLAFLLSVPLITAMFARRMGRPPVKWFLIGCLLPVIATVILFFCRICRRRKSERGTEPE